MRLTLKFLKPLLFIFVLALSNGLLAQLKKENKLLIARLELSEKEYQSAIEKFNAIIKNNLPNYEPYYYRGIAKLELGEGETAVIAPMQGTVISVDAKAGDSVAKGQTLAVLEAMKMEHTLRAPRDGVIAEVMAAEGWIGMGWPIEHGGHARPPLERVIVAEELIAAQQLIRRIPVGDAVIAHILDLVRSARPDTEEGHPTVRSSVSWGPGPRAAQALMLAVRAHALLDGSGRDVPTEADVYRLAEPILKHRMELTYAAKAESVTLTDVIAELVEAQKARKAA